MITLLAFLAVLFPLVVALEEVFAGSVLRNGSVVLAEVEGVAFVDDM